MMQWKSHGCQGLDYDACTPKWKKIMESLEGRTQGIAVIKCDKESFIQKALMRYASEGIVNK
jgi:hypothetical protein